jgi:hypothetical protein
MTVAQWIDSQPVFLGDDWVSALETRKQEEATFHDAYRADHWDDSVHESGNLRFYQAAEPMSRFLRAWIGRECRDKTVLDYACGGGAGFGQVTRFLQRDCEATQLPSESFDRILCLGMLHHLDLRRAFPELHRLLRAGGKILCVEALHYNPAIRLYRRLTPQYRTGWESEHILSLRDVRYARQWFEVESMRYFCLASPLFTLLPVGRLRRVGIAIGHALDAVFTRTPGLQLWSWQFAFELGKRQ